jgi:hypothetical protein
MSVEFSDGSGLSKAHTARLNHCLRIVLAAHRSAREAAEHRQLARVRQSVSNRTLEQTFRRPAERLTRGEIRIERCECGEKARDLVLPWHRCRIVPRVMTAREAERPIEEVAHVRENLRGCARAGRDGESGKFLRRVSQRLAGTVRQRRHRMPKKFAFSHAY